MSFHQASEPSTSNSGPTLLDFIFDVDAALSRSLTPAKRKHVVARMKQRREWLKYQEGGGRMAAGSRDDGRMKGSDERGGIGIQSVQREDMDMEEAREPALPNSKRRKLAKK